MSSTLTQPSATARVVDRDSCAWDAELVDATLAGGSDYVPACAVARAFYVGVTGNVGITTGAGNQIVFTNVAAGTLFPIVFSSIQHATTTATGLVALA